MTNPLLATPQNDTSAVTGIGIAESSVDLATGLSNGDWVAAGLGAVGVGLEVLSMVIDPIGTLASYGVSWLIEHVQPLKEALDWFAGDPPVIRAFSETWGRVAGEVAAVAKELSRQDVADWRGAAADAYRGVAAQTADAVAGAGALADGISAGVMIMGEVVAAVREMIRDLVGEVVGKLITWALEAVATLGLATPLIVAQAASTVAKVVNKISDLVRKLVKTISNVAPRIRKVIDKLGEIMEKLRKLGRRADGGSPGTTSPAGAPNSPDAPPPIRGGDATSTSSASSSPSTPQSPSTPASPSTPSTPDTPDSPSSPGSTTSPSRTPDGQRSPDRPDNPKDTSTPEPQRRCENDPVDVVTGEVVLPQTDVELPGALPLLVRRTHISSFRSGRLFGANWASTLDQRIELDELGAVYVADDGMRLIYPSPRHEAVMPSHGPRWPLAQTADGYTVTRSDGTTAQFGPDGRLAAIVDRNGHRMSLRYDDAALAEIEHSGGYRVRVDTADGLVTGLRLTHAGGEIVLMRYRYDQRRLAEVVNSSNQPMRFDYDQDGRMTGWQDRNGSWYRYVYDDRGWCVRTVGAEGFLDGAFEYGADVTVFTDSLGARKTFRLNELRQIVEETDPLGNTTVSQWDRYDRLVAQTDPTGAVTRYEYDAAGAVVRIVRADGTETTVRRNDLGLPVEITEPGGAVWRRECDERGNVTAVTDPLGHTTRYRFDERGNLAAVADHLGHERRIHTNDAGLTTALIDTAGNTLRYERDALGRVTSVVDATGATVRYGWTIEGKPAWRTLADGATERWRYDGEGNCVEHVSPAGQRTQVTYNAFDLPSSRTRPDGTTLRFGYDTNLRLVSVTDPEGAVWRYDYDPAGRIVQETDFHGRVLRYGHDAAGRLVERVDATGTVVTQTRDVLGRVIEQRSGDNVTTFSYDDAGRITRAVNPDADLVCERDLLGRIVAETSNGHTVTSTYDELGRRVRRTLPSGVDSDWQFDPAARPARLEFGGHRIRFGYDALGREHERVIDDRFVLSQTWDASHRLASQTLTAGDDVLQQRSYQYSPAGDLREVTDRLSGPRKFELDVLGRVTAVRAAGWTERYVYDAAGRVRQADSPDGTSGPRDYAGARLVRRGADRYRYDAQGRVVLRQHKPPSAKVRNWHYTWDGDRMVGLVTPEGDRWRYRYDALGRRVRKERLAADDTIAEHVDFVWDSARLVEQTHITGTTSRTTAWDWEPGSFRPVAQLVLAPQEEIDRRFQAIVTDLAGSPSELVDPDAGTVWHNQATLWGSTSDPDGTPHRFQGQYFDAESGLHYNFHRYYDPGTARYLSADPLGLAPGPDPYAYAANPHREADPLGLTVEDCTTRLNLGSGQNPMPGAVNTDITPGPGVDVVADANHLPFADGSFNEVHSVNPYGYQPVSAETARVLEPGGTLTVSGSPVNRFIRRAPDDPSAFGLELVSEGPLTPRHQFGTQTRVDGSTFDTGNHITRVYRRI
ncbi:DUF6531 domain-containing protein [Lentzea sp. NPDC051213]|uniref:DUF6531 domain-containing protein n=1 Tax=Lentzea sp. NPDC051213 TaxID=3364126 RepID=UPI00379FF6FF